MNKRYSQQYNEADAKHRRYPRRPIVRHKYPPGAVSDADAIKALSAMNKRTSGEGQ
jgi:hypothetical protein